MCQCTFIDYNKCIILVADADSDGVCVCARVHVQSEGQRT